MKRHSIRDGISLGLMIGVAKITYDWVMAIDNAVAKRIVKLLENLEEKLKEENEHAQDGNDTTGNQSFSTDEVLFHTSEGPIRDCAVGTERAGESEPSGESD